MWNAWLAEVQAGIKIAGRNIITIMAESTEELKSLLMKVKEYKSWLKAHHSKKEDHGVQSHHFIANRC